MSFYYCSLQELHLSLNSSDIVPSSVTVKFPSVSQLYVNKCGLSHWEDFCRLSNVFPCLEQLIADSNPLQQIATIPLHNSDDKLLHDSECVDEASGQMVMKRYDEKKNGGTAIDCHFKDLSLETANEIH